MTKQEENETSQKHLEKFQTHTSAKNLQLNCGWLHNKLYLILHFLSKLSRIVVLLFSNLSPFGFACKIFFHSLSTSRLMITTVLVRMLTRTHAVILPMWHPLNLGGLFFSAHLHHIIELLTFVLSPAHLDLVAFAKDMEQTLCLCHRYL